MMRYCFCRNLFVELSVILFISVFICVVPARSQSQIIEDLSFRGSVLQDNVQYAVYLPKGYRNSQQKYPVLYLLHGYGNDETAWIQYGNMKQLMDNGIENGSMTPMIVMMPDAGNSWYINDLESRHSYESMFIQELIPFVDEKYRTRNSEKFRAVGGLSMGAYGALVLSFKNPATFAAAFALSPAIWTDQEIQKLSTEDYSRMFGNLYTTNPENRLTTHWYSHSVLHAASIENVDSLSGVNYYINSGDDDKGISEATAELHQIFKQRGVPHEYRVYNGGHTWDYWRKTFPEPVEFISDIFLDGVD